MPPSFAREIQALEDRGVFLGGPRHSFSTAGRKQMIALLAHGMTPRSKVLDIGCGALRAGHWLVRFLEPGCYFGIEPNKEMLQAGIDVLLGPEMVEAKRPAFSTNDDFAMTHFGERFDLYVARSIWSHTSKAQIETMLDGFVATCEPGATFLASYFSPSEDRADYTGTEWVGLSHESEDAGTVAHSLEWIQEVCGQRGLSAQEARNSVFNFGAQTWLRIRHAA